MKFIKFALVPILIIGALILSNALYVVKETEQVIITQFGEAIGDPITEPGLKVKRPFFHRVNRFDKRVLEWDGDPSAMPTKEKTYIQVDTYGRWRIVDPLRYFQKLRDERSARSRLDDILGSETRNAVAKHALAEIVRSDKDRKPQQEAEIAEADKTGNVGRLAPIRRGRGALEQDILNASRDKLAEFGIELLDVRFKRINYNKEVEARIYERMISERKQIAERFRSEGAGEAAKIIGNMEKELRQIESESYKKVEMIKGEADAKASEVYAKAYGSDPEAANFYEFTRTMELYRSLPPSDSTIILSTDSDVFQFLKSDGGEEE